MECDAAHPIPEEEEGQVIPRCVTRIDLGFIVQKLVFGNFEGQQTPVGDEILHSLMQALDGLANGGMIGWIEAQISVRSVQT
jgi:hypothetical protein